ncbi:MAG TPA: hypothetical protein VHE13_13160 [Opitutus sp.]|nr:hypothetical protein [Opitutus sp.]
MSPAPEARPWRTAGELLRHPSAFVPLLCSVAALLVLAVHVARFGVVREADEGAAAHVWQLLMAGQGLGILYFAANWVPRSPRSAILILGGQLAAAGAALLPVYLLHL